MSKRDKASLLGAGVLVLVFLFFQFGISPFLEKRKIFERQLEEKTKMLSEIIELQNEYRAILDNNNYLKKIYSKRDKDFTLFAFLEHLAGSAGVKDNIEYMKPSTKLDKQSNIEFSIVEMKLKQIKTSQLISYLYMVETSKNVVFVKHLGIKRNDKNKNSISAVLLAETVKS